MDCHRPSAFAMTKGAKSDEFFYFLWMNKIIVVMDCHDFCEVSQWRRGQGVVFTNSSLRELLATSGNLSMRYNYSFMEFFFFSVFVFVISGCGLLRRFAPRNDSTPTPSLRELLATRGNLSIGYNYSFMEFFFFSVFVFIISGCGLLRRFTRGLASLCKGGSCEATGGLREKLKIETQSGKMISLLNHFSLSSHKVRNERSIRNWKLKIKKLIFYLKLIL